MKDTLRDVITALEKMDADQLELFFLSDGYDEWTLLVRLWGFNEPGMGNYIGYPLSYALCSMLLNKDDEFRQATIQGLKKGAEKSKYTKDRGSAILEELGKTHNGDGHRKLGADWVAWIREISAPENGANQNP